MMFQLLGGINTGHYVQSTTGWYNICLKWFTPGIQVLSNMLLHATHAQGICHISHFHYLFYGLIKYYHSLLNTTLCGVYSVEHKITMK